jgi:hypothetical protein
MKPTQIMKRGWNVRGRRFTQLGLLLLVGGLSAGGGIVLWGTSAYSSSTALPTSSTGDSTTATTLPAEIPVAGPNGYVGTVPNSDLTQAPTLSAAGTPPAPSAYRGASVVVEGLAGYPVTNAGELVGYWVPGNMPSTYMPLAQAGSEGAVPSDGASAVGTDTAVTPAPAQNVAP